MRDRAWVSPALLGLCGALLVLELWRIWALDESSYFAIAGLVPYSDAHGYLRGARSLIELGHLDEWSSRRPLYASFLAGLYWLCGGALRPVLLAQTLAAAGALWLAVRELQRRAGASAAVLCVGATCFHYSLYAGATLSEPLGLLLGALAFAFCARGFAARDRVEIAAGVFLLSLALSARSGAYLSLPLLVLYGAFVLRGPRWIDARALGAFSLSALAGLAVSPLLLLAIGPEQYGYQGNFSYVLYGLAAGGKGWMYVLTAHPEVLELSSDTARSDAIYRLAIAEIERAPLALVWAIAAKWWDAFLSPLASLYGFMGPWRFALALPAAAGALAVFRDLRSGAHRWGFLAPVVLGVLLSMPVLIEGDDRVQAATVLFGCAFAAVGLSALIGLAWPRSEPDPSVAARATPLWIASAAVVLLCVAGPVLLRLASPGPSSGASWTCEADEVPMLYRHRVGEGVAVTPRTIRAIARSALVPKPLEDVPSGEFRSILDLLPSDPNEYTYVFLANAELPDARRVRLCSRALVESEFAHNVYRSRVVGIEPE